MQEGTNLLDHHHHGTILWDQNVPDRKCAIRRLSCRVHQRVYTIAVDPNACRVFDVLGGQKNLLIVGSSTVDGRRSFQQPNWARRTTS